MVHFQDLDQELSIGLFIFVTEYLKKRFLKQAIHLRIRHTF